MVLNFVEFITNKLLFKNIKLNYDKFEYITNDQRMKTLTVRENVELIAQKVIRVYGVWFNVGSALSFQHNYNLYMEHIVKITHLACKLSKMNKSISGHVMNNIAKS